MGAGTWESHHAITSLIYRYTEYVDAGAHQKVGELLSRATLATATAGGRTHQVAGAAAIADLYRQTNKLYPGGTPLTRHLCGNVLVDIDEGSGTASASSAYVVFQASPNVPLQPIVAGRYEDRFARTDGEWHFIDRLIHVGQVGNLSDHLSIILE